MVKDMASKKNRGPWIQTYSHIRFHPEDPRPEDIRIEDIAHALSNQCRFAGHTREFYSVAEHSICVSLLCDPKDALQGLLHDASEAYIGDMASPTKKLPGMVYYRELEKKIMSAIYNAFGVSVVETPSVVQADKAMVEIEAHQLLGPVLTGWKGAETWDGYSENCNLGLIKTWSPREAEKAFLRRFSKLYDTI